MLDAHVDDMNVVTPEDPEMFGIQLSHHRGWMVDLSDTGMKNLRAYLQKGGFPSSTTLLGRKMAGLPGGGWSVRHINVRRCCRACSCFST